MSSNTEYSTATRLCRRHPTGSGAQQTMNTDMHIDTNLDVNMGIDSALRASETRMKSPGTNNLKFSPALKSNQFPLRSSTTVPTRNKLTRSAGTLNLMVNSVDTNKENLAPIGEATGGNTLNNNFINHKMLARNTVNAPFLDNLNSRPVTPTDSGFFTSKNDINTPVSNVNMFTVKKQKNIPITCSPSNDSANVIPYVFSPKGLRSKYQQYTLFPEKLSIPSTPVKNSSLRVGLNTSANESNYSSTHTSSIMSDRSSNMLFNSTYSTSGSDTFPVSPTRQRTPNLYTGKSSHSSFSQSSSPMSQDDTPSMRSSLRHSNERKYKKMKKLGDSVLFKNMELTSILQEFMDDLYDVDDNDDNNNGNSSSSTKNMTIENDGMIIDSLNTPTKIRGTSRFMPPTLGTPSYASSPSKHVRRVHRLPSPPTSSGRHEALQSHQTQQNFQLHIQSRGSSKQVTHRNINAKVQSNHLHEELFEKFTNVRLIGRGNFSCVYQVTYPETNKRYAVKFMYVNKRNTSKKIHQEIKILAELAETEDKSGGDGRDYVIDFISSWKSEEGYYVMTNFYENGNLDAFLLEHIVTKNRRLDDWRIWKIIVELCLALRFLHESCHIVHLDVKPANVFITFEGSLKLGDFGMSARLPLEDPTFENEGDREYIAPEIISDGIYDFRADIFSLGLMIVEIAANVILPDNGTAWRKLRSGDLSDAGRLSSMEIHSSSIFSNSMDCSTRLTSDTLDTVHEDVLNTDSKGNNNMGGVSTLSATHNMPVPGAIKILQSDIPAWVPRFLIDGESLRKMVQWMIHPDYRKRPTANDILCTEECEYVEVTRRAGAVIHEDDFGPKPRLAA